MPFHRKAALRALTNPPLPISTLNDMLADGRIPPPDTYAGRTPLWSEETVERIKEDFQRGMRSRRKRNAKHSVDIENSPTT
jgi:hypothetical protein